MIELTLSQKWMVMEPQGRWEGFTGQSFDDYRGWGWLLAIHEADREAVVARRAELGRKSGPVRDTHRVRSADGGYRRLVAHIEPHQFESAASEDGASAWKIRYVPVEDAEEVSALEPGLSLDWNVVADQLQEGVITADPGGRITFVNPVARDLHGIVKKGVGPGAYTSTYNLFTLEGEPYPPEDLPLSRAVRGEVVRNASWIIRPPGAAELIVRGDAMPIRNVDGDQIGSLLTCRDVTEEERLQSTLKRERQILSTIFEESPVFKAVLRGPELRFEMVNPAYRALVGDRELLGLIAKDALPDLADQHFFDALEGVYSTGEAYRTKEERVFLRSTDDGSHQERWVDFTYQPLTDARGCVDGVLATGIDVTEQVERRREEVRLREEVEVKTRAVWERERRFREIAENIEGVFWSSAPDKSAIEYLSPAFEHVWGLPRTDVYEDVGVWRGSIHPDDRARVAEEVVSQVEDRRIVEYRIVRPDGDVRWIRSRSSPVREDSGEVRRIVGISEDVTERVRLEDRLRQAQKMEALGSMAGRIAHDFNNILTSITGLAHLGRSGLLDGQSPEEELDGISDSVDRASALTKQLLAFSRGEDTEPETTDLHGRIRGIRRMVEVLVGERVEVRYRLDPRDALVLCLPHEIEQVVVNLAANARDAMPDGGILTVESHLISLPNDELQPHAALLPAGSYVEVRVSDTGTGMSEETLGKVFDPMFTTKRRGQGTGLGLSTVFGIVRQRGGHVWAESQPGNGTIFHILLPTVSWDPAERPELCSSRQCVDEASTGSVSVRAKGARGSESADQGGPAGSDATPRVLLVDDEDHIRTVLSKLLQRYGYAVSAHSSGDEALQAAEGERVDLVITDLCMEGTDPRELLDGLRARLADVPVIFASGHDRTELASYGIPEEEVGFLQKPFTPNTLRSTVDRALASVETGPSDIAAKD